LLLIDAKGYYAHVNSRIIVDTPHELRFEVTLKTKVIISIAGGIGGIPASSLFDLYRNSDLVALAQVGRSVVAESDGEMKLLKSTLKISSLLKGQNESREIPFYHWANDFHPARYNRDEKLLVFLRPRESENGGPLDGYEATDWSGAIRILDDAMSTSYRQRIEELASILQRSTPDPAEIAEWLVRLVEDPITRVEGVMKLDRALLQLQEQKEEATEEETEDDEADPGEQSVRAAIEKEKKADALIAAALTEDQKNRLANALYAIQELTESDMDLVRLIQSLEDKRLPAYLVTQLQRIADDAPGLALSLTRIMASTIEDQDLIRLANDYSDAVRYDAYNSFKPSLDADSASERRPVEEKISGLKRSPLLKNFLNLVEYKTRR